MKFLVLAPQGLGDSLEATPFLARVRDAHSEAHVTVAVLRPAARELFSGLPKIVDEVVYLPYWEQGGAAFAAAALRVLGRRYDASFTMFPAARREYHFLVRALAARRRIGHRYAVPAFSNGLWAYTDLVDIASKHNVERNLDLLDAAGISGRAPAAYLVPQDWHSPNREAKSIAVHLGSIDHDGFANKRWPHEAFVRVVRHMLAAKLDVTLIAGPDEAALTSAFHAELPETKVFTGTLPELARFLDSTALVLANDSGVAHLAAAVGTPTITLFGPTPLTGAPYSPAALALRPTECPPCFDLEAGLSRGCIQNIDFACLKRDLTPELVIAAVLRKLSVLEHA